MNRTWAQFISLQLWSSSGLQDEDNVSCSFIFFCFQHQNFFLIFCHHRVHAHGPESWNYGPDFGSVFFRTIWCCQELRIDEKNTNRPFQCRHNAACHAIFINRWIATYYLHGSISRHAKQGSVHAKRPYPAHASKTVYTRPEHCQAPRRLRVLNHLWGHGSAPAKLFRPDWRCAFGLTLLQRLHCQQLEHEYYACQHKCSQGRRSNVFVGAKARRSAHRRGARLLWLWLHKRQAGVPGWPTAQPSLSSES